MKKKLRFISLMVLALMSFSVQSPELPAYVGGVYLGDGKFECKTERTCLHELGHAVDEWRGFPSETDAFRKAVDDYIEANRKSYLECSREVVCRLQDFPGINGNPMRVIEDGGLWGGYGEAYAEIYAQWKTWSPLPVELQPFYHWVGNNGS